MASVRKHPHSSFWHACYTKPDGRQTQCSTKLRIKDVSRDKALAWAEAKEQAYRVKRGEAHFRKHMNEVWLALSGTPLPSSTPETFFASWLKRRKNELNHSSFLRYSGIVRSFLEFLGEKAQDDLSTLCSADIRRFRDYQADRMSATSANLSRKVLCNAFKGAMAEGLDGEPGSQRIRRPSQTERRKPPASRL
jgi:hypothetical protein